MRITKSSIKASSIKASSIMSADDEEFWDDEIPEDDESLESVGNEDELEDDQDVEPDEDLSDYEEDDPSVNSENNIDGHYIAECEKCHGIFIASVVESDQEVSSISGECPLCGDETDQLLKWVIQSVEKTEA